MNSRCVVMVGRDWDLYSDSRPTDRPAWRQQDEPASNHLPSGGRGRPHARHGIWTAAQEDCRTSSRMCRTFVIIMWLTILFLPSPLMCQTVVSFFKAHIHMHWCTDVDFWYRFLDVMCLSVCVNPLLPDKFVTLVHKGSNWTPHLTAKNIYFGS